LTEGTLGKGKDSLSKSKPPKGVTEKKTELKIYAKRIFEISMTSMIIMAFQTPSSSPPS
jgi:hypothetical protein